MSASARIAGYPRTKSEVINLLETTRMIVRRAEPPLLEAYLSLNAIFEKSSLTNTERQLVMLAVSQANGCEYCLPVDRVPSLISLSGPTRAPSPRSGSATFGGLEMLRTGFLWLIWSLAFWGTLKLSDAPILQDHGVCGIWGCGPPTNALLACHLGWMVFLAPSIPLAFHYFPHRRQLLSVVFCVLFSAGLLGVLVSVHQNHN